MLIVTCLPWENLCEAIVFFNLLATTKVSSLFVRGKIIKNSSPPQRPMTSISRILSFRMFAISCKTLSPVRCPKLSLINLKKSMSRSKTEQVYPLYRTTFLYSSSNFSSVLIGCINLLVYQ